MGETARGKIGAKGQINLIVIDVILSIEKKVIDSTGLSIH